eukprot:TRINITY_DN1711_c0_g1_i1.p1 TRINITY_DN1711_c0_g1~~TRINITY_DN1711_c0_g1_i1.p1  ORF type:complete len:396 (-),score=90.35 TRINITY_DN1711_c0_g1_i1:907-2094(-)
MKVPGDANWQRAKAIVDEVYSIYTGAGWKPQRFKGRSGRYLWSDAFGVCNYLSLHKATEEGGRASGGSSGSVCATPFLDQADALIHDVHEVLGRERHLPYKRLGDASDDHPLVGGLRIGKEDDEGAPDGDGQYFHYLTKWMFALMRMSEARGDDKYLKWAVEMAQAVHPRFVNMHLGRMHWKMSIDLERPLVPSEGHLDPLDGLVTYRLLHDASGGGDVLRNEIAQMETLVNKRYATFRSTDPLDAGEGIWLTTWYAEESWSLRLLNEALDSASSLFRMGYFEQPRGYRLLFREMGTTLGIQAAAAGISTADAAKPAASGKEAHAPFEGGALQPARAGSQKPGVTLPFNARMWEGRVDSLHRYWDNHIFDRDRDISPLMYASSLLPTAWLPAPRA